MPIQRAIIDLPVIWYPPPRESSANITASAPHGIETYIIKNDTIEIMLKINAASSILLVLVVLLLEYKKLDIINPL